MSNEEKAPVGASSSDSMTALDYIQSQEKLEEEAREVMPYDPNHCTHHDEPVRQQILTCLTCSKKNDGEKNGICYSCSIQCHSDHEVVELLTKRNFTCDCGTTRMKSFGGCNLRKNFKQLDDPSKDNIYNHNHDGVFCECKEAYTTDRPSTMFQCLLGDACQEDWYHEECILGIPLREKVQPKKGENLYDKLESAESENVQAADEEIKDTLDGLPNSDDFAAFICWKCVDKNRSILAKFGQWKDVSLDPVYRQVKAEAGVKRKAESEPEEQEVDNKKVKSSDGQAIKKDSVLPKQQSTGQFSLFLAEGYQEVLKACKDPDVVEFIKRYPFLVEDEPEYELPPDNDAASSLLDAGAKALQSLPREQALDGLNAYAMIKDRLHKFLKPFADQGKVVTETDVNEFFAHMSENGAQKSTT